MYDPRTEVLRRALPGMLKHLEAATREGDALEVLERATRDALFDRVTVEGEAGAIQQVDLTGSSGSMRPLVRATYPLGRETVARTRIRFEWRGDEPDVSPQTAILLQLLADGLTRALEKAGSSLVPQHTVEPTRSSSAPAALPLPSSGGSPS
jgi:hypothetical protein